MLKIEDLKKKLDKKTRIMGIDTGKKRVGIDISDENKNSNPVYNNNKK